MYRGVHIQAMNEHRKLEDPIFSVFGHETDVMIFNFFSPKKLAKYWRSLLKLLLVFCKDLIITLLFEKKSFFSPKKIEENRDYNIDPCL
jgi:hypothetical protein